MPTTSSDLADDVDDEASRPRLDVFIAMAKPTEREHVVVVGDRVEACGRAVHELGELLVLR